MKRFWVFLLLCLPLLAAITFPPLTGRVVDEANLLNPQQKVRLSAKLEALENNTTDQLVVVTLKSLHGYDIADYGYQLGRHWGIGQKGKNNGVLLIVAPNERKVRIEVGYGLEGILTDALSDRIIRIAIIPRFRDKDFAGGIEAGVDAITHILQHPNNALSGQSTGKPRRNEKSAGGLFFALFVAVSMALSFLPSYKNIWLSGAIALTVGFLTYFVSDMIVVGVLFGLVVGFIAYFGRSGGGFMSSGGDFGGGYDGGFGGGFDGGFSGGGGSFGGGGASGSW